MPRQSQTPLTRYVRVQGLTDVEMRAALRDAAKEAERLINSLGPVGGVGAQVERARLQVLLRDLRTLESTLFQRIPRIIRQGMLNAAQAAADAELVLDRVLFKAAGKSITGYADSLRIMATENARTLEAKGMNGIPLSRQVYETQALSQGLVDREISRGILLGRSAKQIATAVKGFISPDTPGGVSYASMRLGRTELNNAFHTTQIQLRDGNPWVEGQKWNLSGSHPKPDACNEYAEGVHFRGGDAGVYKSGDAPGKPHPNCLCYLTSEVVGEDEFINSLLGGKYDTYLGQHGGI